MAVTGAMLHLGWSHLHLLFAACLVFVLYKVTTMYVRRKDQIRHTETFPGPPRHWLHGNFYGLKRDGSEVLHHLVKWGKDYPYAFPVWFGPFFCVLNLHHPDYVKTLLSSTEPKDEVQYGFLEPWIGNGLLLSKGQRWFRQRRLLTPGFHYDVLKPYVKLMSESAEIMLNKWERYANTDKAFELFGQVSLMTLETLMKCGFSSNSNCQTDSETRAYINAVYELSNLISLRIRTFPYHSDLIFYLSPHGFRYRKACKVAHTHTDNVIRRRKEILKEETELSRIQAKRNLDFLDILLLARDEKQQGLSDADIRAEVDTFMFEGHDTTASGISFILYCLACHPEHQKLCREEINQVLDGKSTMDWEDLSKIPYTTMCIKECLRLYPPVPGTTRRLTKPLTFPDGRTIAKDFAVGVTIFALHRNSTVWENPAVFDPLRFLPENISKRSPHAFEPFSAGPRNCIGQTFAMNEMKVVIALTLKRYQLIEDPALKPRMVTRIVLRSLNGVHIKIKPVDTK